MMRTSVPLTSAAFLLALLTVPADAMQAPSSEPRPFPADSLERANELYAERRYRSAGGIYDRLLAGAQEERYRRISNQTDAGSLLGALHFNRANAYLQAGELGRAILHYEKARRYLGSHSALRNNLEIARGRIEEPVPELPRPFWERWALTAADTLGSRGLFYLGLLGYLVFLTCALFRAAGTRRRYLVRAITAVSLVMTGVGVGGSFTYAYHRAHVERAVVLEEATPLYHSPQEASDPSRRLSEGVRIRVRTDAATADSSWLPVRLSDGETGWMRAESLGRI